jgi:hypothetical protein
MKIDADSVYVGMGIVGTFAGCLGVWGRRLARIFAASLAGFLAFELFCLVASPELLRFVWWAVHMPSAIALGADEILERHGKLVSTAFHLADFFLWSAVITGAVWLYDRRHRDETHAA